VTYEHPFYVTIKHVKCNWNQIFYKYVLCISKTECFKVFYCFNDFIALSVSTHTREVIYSLMNAHSNNHEAKIVLFEFM